MIPEHMEPIGLAPDALPLADYGAVSFRRSDALRGSRKLRDALLRLQRKRLKRKPRPCLGRPRSIAARRMARAQTVVIQRAAAEHFGITVADLTGGRGPLELSRKRQIAMFIARELTTASYPDIGYCFGRRDHTTVMHACRVVEWDTDAVTHIRAIRARLAA